MPSPYHPDKQRFLKGGFISFSLEHVHMIQLTPWQLATWPAHNMWIWRRPVLGFSLQNHLFLSLFNFLSSYALFASTLKTLGVQNLQFFNSAVNSSLFSFLRQGALCAHVVARTWMYLYINTCMLILYYIYI